MTIPTKLVLILTTGFRGYFQTFLHNGNWPIPLATMFLTDQTCFSCFWGRMLASRLHFNTYNFSVTSIFQPCQAKHYNMLHSLQSFNHISYMVSILTI